MKGKEGEERYKALDKGIEKHFCFHDQVKMKITEFIIFPLSASDCFRGNFLGKGFCTLLCHGGMLLLKRLKTK